MGKLSNKVAIVTGASKGLGASIAKHLAAEGAAVVVNYSSSKKEADQVVSAIKKEGGKAIAIQANMTKETDIDHLFAETKSHFGRLDILVNNAGVYDLLPLEKVTEDHFHKHFNLNVLGLLLAIKKAVPLFDERGGSIINMSSIAGVAPQADASVYCASKAAVDAITKSLSKELGPKKIRVNSLNPGMIVTEGLRETGIADSDMRKEIEKTTPLGGLGRPEDIAKAVLFFASDDSGWISGETIIVAGGRN